MKLSSAKVVLSLSIAFAVLLKSVAETTPVGRILKVLINCLSILIPYFASVNKERAAVCAACDKCGNKSADLS